MLCSGGARWFQKLEVDGAAQKKRRREKKNKK
jgi:hypothetical protein